MSETAPEKPKKPVPWQYGLIIAAVFYILFSDPIKLWLNFQMAKVSVETVEILCIARPKEQATPLKIGACDAVEVEFKARTDVDIRKQTFVNFHYTSPVDGQAREGRIARDKDDDGQPIEAGKMITVHLSTKNPELIKPE